MRLKLDMHVHTCQSFDSVQTIEQIVAVCKQKGIDGVCICDHNVSRNSGIEIIDGVLIIPGVELGTIEGHVLGYCIESEAGYAKSLDRAIDNVKAAGGLAVLAHPYERQCDSRESIDKLINELTCKLDGIEVANARADMFVRSANTYARAAAMINRKPVFGGSDAHLPHEVGGAYTELDIDCDSIYGLTLDKLREALVNNGADATLASRSKCVNAAKSQYIRMKNMNASKKRWCRYWCYAVKCVLTDMRNMLIPVRKDK